MQHADSSSSSSPDPVLVSHLRYIRVLAIGVWLKLVRPLTLATADVKSALPRNLINPKQMSTGII